MNHPLMLRLSSNPKNIEYVEPFVEKLVKQYHISPDMYGNILISLTEAVNNAIRHGNCNDQNKTVKVSMQKVNEHKIAFQISDEYLSESPGSSVSGITSDRGDSIDKKSTV